MHHMALLNTHCMVAHTRAMHTHSTLATWVMLAIMPTRRTTWVHLQVLRITHLS